MKLSGSYTLNGPRQKVWSLIYNPASLVKLIPGCDQLDQVSPDEYRGQMQVRLPGVTGVYKTYVKILERENFQASRFAGEVEGSAGSIKGTAFFTLTEVNPHQTAIEYEGQAIISGALARLNDRFIEGIARTLIDQGLAKLNQQVQAEVAVSSSIEKPDQDSFFSHLIRKIRAFFQSLKSS